METPSKLSGLHPTGLVVTHPDAEAWSKKVEAAIKARFAGAATATLWPYRIGKHEYLACDIRDDQGNDYSITFQIGHRSDFHFDPHSCEPSVPDMTEALHMASIVLGAVSACVTVGRRPRQSPVEREA